MPITKEQWDLAQAANPGIEIEIIVPNGLPDDEVIARPVTTDAWMTYMKMRDADQGPQASLFLAQSGIVFPERAELNKRLERRPGLAQVYAGQIVQITGLREGATRKKF